MNFNIFNMCKNVLEL